MDVQHCLTHKLLLDRRLQAVLLFHDCSSCGIRTMRESLQFSSQQAFCWMSGNGRKGHKRLARLLKRECSGTPKFNDRQHIASCLDRYWVVQKRWKTPHSSLSILWIQLWRQCTASSFWISQSEGLPPTSYQVCSKAKPWPVWIVLSFLQRSIRLRGFHLHILPRLW